MLELVKKKWSFTFETFERQYKINLIWRICSKHFKTYLNKLTKCITSINLIYRNSILNVSNFTKLPEVFFFIVIIDMKLFPTKLTKCTWWLRVTRYHMICRIFPVLELQGLKTKKRKLFLKCQQLEWFWRLQIVFLISSDNNIKKRKLKTFFLIL